jgi:hypothetical protein
MTGRSVTYRMLPLLAVVGLLGGCAAYPGGPARRETGAHYLPQKESVELLERLARLNETLFTFKGVGKVILVAEGSRRSARIAWAGTAPDKLRVEIMGLPGQPTASLALNGEWIAYDPHSPEGFYRHRLGKDSLRQILRISITAADIIDLFRGRLPLREHTAAALFKPLGESGYVLQLEKRWWGVQEKIHWDDALERVDRFEIFRPGGELSYRVTFDRVDTVGGYRVPRRLVISNDDGDRFELSVDRFLPNVAVDPDVFELTPRS